MLLKVLFFGELHVKHQTVDLLKSRVVVLVVDQWLVLIKESIHMRHEMNQGMKDLSGVGFHGLVDQNTKVQFVVEDVFVQ